MLARERVLEQAREPVLEQARERVLEGVAAALITQPVVPERAGERG